MSHSSLYVVDNSNAWNFYIAAYQPLQKWLKDRKGFVLKAQDIAHYQHMIQALQDTKDIMSEIDSMTLFYA